MRRKKHKLNMDTYCIYCKKETQTEIVRTSIDNRKKEKKVKGYCISCGEPVCQVIYYEPEEDKVSS